MRPYESPAQELERLRRENAELRHALEEANTQLWHAIEAGAYRTTPLQMGNGAGDNHGARRAQEIAIEQKHMNHFRHICDRVNTLREKADLDAGESGATGDLAIIVRDLAAEVSLIARLLDEPRLREIMELEIHEQAQNLTSQQAIRLAKLRG